MLESHHSSRIHALTLTELADAQCARGAVEKACQTWNQAMEEMAGIRSARTREAVKAMRKHLASYRRRGLAVVSQLDARASAFLQT